MPEERRIELEVINGPMDGYVFSMSREKFSIGRDPENDISLSQDRKIKKLSHVEISADGTSEWSLIKNGRGKVHVNDRRVSGPVKLVTGDQVKIGKTLLLVNRTSPPKPGDVEEDPLKPPEKRGTLPVHRI